MTRPTISIVIPAFNEELNIGLVYQQVARVLSSENFEVLFIDDGSHDGTSQEIKKLSETHPQVKGVSFSRNFGHQAAIKAGFDYAEGDCVISIDCDLEHPPEYIPQMIKMWRAGADVVISRRTTNAKLPLFKRGSSKAFYFLLRFISDVPVESGSADFRLLDRKVVDACRRLTENELFWRGLIPWLGFKTEYLNYQQAFRQHGESKYSFVKMLKLSVAGVTSFSVKPLYLSLYLGAFFASSSFLYLAYAVVIKLFTAKSVSGWASVIASVLLIGGVQLFVLGVMGVYLGKMFAQSKGRPHYIVRETISLSASQKEMKRAG
ncbi:MAG: glycosyltransferase [Proteobacteria bacterium]|nr:glycosyltransferase [Pseudomonadota bacterium]